MLCMDGEIMMKEIEATVEKYINNKIHVIDESMFNNLSNNELIYVNNEDKEVVSDIKLSRYDDFNNNYLELVRGINRLEITGACKLDFRYQYVFKG